MYVIKLRLQDSYLFLILKEREMTWIHPSLQGETVRVQLNKQ